MFELCSSCVRITTHYLISRRVCVEIVRLVSLQAAHTAGAHGLRRVEARVPDSASHGFRDRDIRSGARGNGVPPVQH